MPGSAVFGYDLNDDLDDDLDLDEEELAELDDFIANLKFVYQARETLASEGRTLAKARVILEDIQKKSLDHLAILAGISPQLAKENAPLFRELKEYSLFLANLNTQLELIHKNALLLEEKAFGKSAYIVKFMRMESHITSCVRAWTEASYLGRSDVTASTEKFFITTKPPALAQAFLASKQFAAKKSQALDQRLDRMRILLINIVQSRDYTPIICLEREAIDLYEATEGLLNQLEDLKDHGRDLDSIVLNALRRFSTLKRLTSG